MDEFSIRIQQQNNKSQFGKKISFG